MANISHQRKGFSGKVHGFSRPTQLPESDEQARAWQEANRLWWEQAPMRYDWRVEINAKRGTADYFTEIDRRFFEAVAHYMPWKSRPFDSLIDYAMLRDKDVLEIGVGHGSHAQLIAPFCRRYVGIDLTRTAVEMTRSRLSNNGIVGNVIQMDAEQMSFPNEAFDFIWSWGVIHHSANTKNILLEMRRILRPGGSAVVMVYHRSPWKYYVMDGFFKGLMLGGLFRDFSLHRVSQRATDGAIARYYTIQEWKDLCAGVLCVEGIAIKGQKSDLIPLPAGGLKDAIGRWLPDAACRFLTDRLRLGSFLLATMRTPSSLP